MMSGKYLKISGKVGYRKVVISGCVSEVGD